MSTETFQAILPGLLIGAYFIGGLVIYLIRGLIKEWYVDPELEKRGASVLIGFGARYYFAWVMQPIFTLLTRLKVPANAITTLSVFLAAGAGVAVAVGRFSLGGWLYLSAGACDFVDGRLARATGQASKAGAALDSVLDRYAEMAVMIGLAWFYRETWVLLVVLAALTGSMLVSYVRARGEGLGVDVKVGLMQRPERVVLIGLSLAVSPIVEAFMAPPENPLPHRMVAMVILIIAIGTHLTSFRRLVHVLNVLDVRRRVSWERATGRGSILRTVISAAIATGCDFVTVWLLVDYTAAPPWLATALGCIVGGAINFTINRTWAFASNGPEVVQAAKYVLVSASSALLNSSGVAVLLLLPGLDYRIAWAIVRGAVFLAWNYPLHRDYVFIDEDEAEADPESTEAPRPA